MPKFRVLVQQYVEQVGHAEIEAATPEEAKQKAKDMGLYEACGDTWREGDDAYTAEVYSVLDAAGHVVWER